MLKKEYIKPEAFEYEIKLNAQFMTPSIDVHKPTDPDIEGGGEIDENW